MVRIDRCFLVMVMDLRVYLYPDESVKTNNPKLSILSYQPQLSP